MKTCVQILAGPYPYRVGTKLLLLGQGRPQRFSLQSKPTPAKNETARMFGYMCICMCVCIYVYKYSKNVLVYTYTHTHIITRL